jgi:site-specific DNA-methyltransferase (adenine-specific)
MEIKLLNGDCLIKLKELEDNSVDSIVTDPPYHLTSITKRFGKENSAPAQYGTDGLYQRASKGFMGKEWDGGDIAFNTDVWDECLRVLKPGGHLLAFGGTRTYHRMTVAIEDSGFEIRDCIFWCYGSGFPKSHNIGKAIDKLEGNEREAYERPDFVAKSNKKKQRDSQVPSGEKGKYTKGNSNFEGWGTALKPAVEPVVMARKPLSEKNIAKNVLEWGTGGINIDESRIGYEDTPNPATNPKYRHEQNYKMPEKGQESKGAVSFTSSNNDVNVGGRFPANLILDEEAGKMLDEQSGITSQGHWPKGKVKGYGEFGGGKSNYEGIGPKDNVKGGASRFFYEVKPDEDESFKPAVEPVVMARKPLSEKNIAQNVIKWGTGGINIDESRIGYADEYDKKHQQDIRKGTGTFFGGNGVSKSEQVDINGRFPANLILDKEAGKMLDEQSGITKSSKRGSNNNKKTEHTNTYTPPAAIYNDENTYGDTGGASRFFYEVKPDEDESFNTELEPVVMARKPLSEKNIAQNVIKWGTGGINIDESRIASSESDKYDIRTYDTYHKTYSSYSETEEKQSFTVKEKNDLGRFPANLIIDEEAGKKLDEQSGNRKGFASQNCNNQKLYGGNSLNKSSTTRDGFKVGFNDEGGASRFFYSPKVSKKERNEGMDKSTNNHPTIKPTSLMLYLIRLVTPKGGTVLDPFMGSGSTGKAAVRSGFNFVGIEREKEYYKIAKSRIEYEKEKLENSTESTLNKFI